MRKNSRGKLSGAVRDETLAEVQRQEEEVSSRDKSAISPDTDAVPMRRWRTGSIIEEPSQYHPDRARSFNFRTVGIVPSKNAEVEELRDWKVNRGDIRGDPGIAREIKQQRIANE